MGNNASTANLAAVGAALGAIVVWALGIFVPPDAMASFPHEGAIVVVTWLFCRFVPQQMDPLHASTSNVAIGLLVLLLALAASGCALTYTSEGGAAVGLYPGLAPSDEVQTLDVTIVGISIDATREAIDLGYKRMQMTRIPGYEEPTFVPTVSTTTSTGAGAAQVEQKLEVNTYEPRRKP